MIKKNEVTSVVTTEVVTTTYSKNIAEAVKSIRKLIKNALISSGVKVSIGVQ